VDGEMQMRIDGLTQWNNGGGLVFDSRHIRKVLIDQIHPWLYWIVEFGVLGIGGGLVV